MGGVRTAVGGGATIKGEVMTVGEVEGGAFI